jgi:hypothetical protein
MLLKRNYDIPEGWEPERAPDGRLLNALPVKSLTIKHTGVHAGQNFSRRLVDAGVAEGWLSLRGRTLTLYTEQDELHYSVLHMPGTYCCHCDQRLDDDPSGASSRQHVETMHAEAASPDPNHPAGYRVTHAYECVLDEAQHAKWQVPAYATVSFARWKDTAPTPPRAAPPASPPASPENGAKE